MMTAAEIENVVRSVLQRVLAGEAAPASTIPNSLSLVAPASGTGTGGEGHSVGNFIAIKQSLITLATLPASFEGVTELRIAEQAVVTPAVKDILRANKIAVVRGGAEIATASPVAETANRSTPTVAPSRPQRIIIAGQALWYSSLRNPLCPKQTKLTEAGSDDATALRTIAAGLRDGHQAGVMIASSPHAACWQAARDDKLRPVVVHDWLESKRILAEVPANLMILDSRRWNVPSTANLIQSFLKHLETT